MQLRHPYALDDGGPTPDDAVHIGGRGDVHPVTDDGVIDVPDDVPESAIEAWASGYGHTVEELRVDDTDICGAEMSDGSTCERPADECPYHEQED